MDPAIANQDFDPPPPPSPGWRGSAAALAVNAFFVAALLWSAPWPRPPEIAGSRPPALGTMGGPPTSLPAGSESYGPGIASQSADTAAPALPPSPPGEVSPPLQPQPQVQAAPAEPPVAPTPAASEHATAAPVRPPPARTPIAAAPPVTQPAPGARPSFDCGKARSRPERLICSDAELARLDRELGRLNVKARSLSQDPVAFRRAGDRAWKRRETECSDKACLLAWYAQRREHLQALVDAAGPAREAGG